MSLKRYLDRKLGTDLRRGIGGFMIAFPFCAAAILALGIVAYHFPILFFLVAGFVSWYWIAAWLAEVN